MNLAKQQLISQTKYVEIIDTLISLVKKKYDISILGGVVGRNHRKYLFTNEQRIYRVFETNGRICKIS